MYHSFKAFAYKALLQYLAIEFSSKTNSSTPIAEWYIDLNHVDFERLCYIFRSIVDDPIKTTNLFNTSIKSKKNYIRKISLSLYNEVKPYLNCLKFTEKRFVISPKIKTDEIFFT